MVRKWGVVVESLRQEFLKKGRVLRDKFWKEIVESCDKCDGAGRLASDGFNVDSCECYENFRVKLRTYLGYLKANIAPAYWPLTLENIDVPDEVKEEVAPILKPENLKIMREEGLGITFYGTNGSGKSTLSNIILKEALKTYNCYYITFSELVELFYRKISNDELGRELDETIKQADFLVIDEMGKEYMRMRDEGDRRSSYILAEFDKLLRYRDRELLPTIMTTNLSEREFKQLYGNSMKSLLSGKNRFILVSGDDYRPKQDKLWDKIK